MLDSRQAMEQRLSNPANEHLSEEILTIIDTELHLRNPYINQFSTLRDVLANQTRLSEQRRESMPTVRMVIMHNIGEDRRRYNDPVATEIAAVYVADTDGAPPNLSERDIVVYPSSQVTQNLSALSCNVDPMTYPVVFPSGEAGWDVQLKQNNDPSSKHLTLRKFYAYRIAIRNVFSTIHSAGLLFQQYLVDAYTKIEGNSLNFIRQNQKTL